MGKFRLSKFYEAQTVRDNVFLQTQFANTNANYSICYASSPKYLAQANQNPSITCVVTNSKYACTVVEQKGLVVVENPEQSFYELHNHLYDQGIMHPPMKFIIHDTARIHPTAVVSQHVYIGKNVIIGPGSIVEAYSHIEDDVQIGPRAIIGASGYFYKRYHGELFEVKHAGGVWIEAGSHILAGAVISKSLHTDFTYIGKQTVLSVNAHVGHGCKIGKRCSIAGNVQISGFSTIGNDVWLGPSVTVTNLIRIEDNARVEIGSVVVRDIPQNGNVSGNFAHEHKQHLRRFVKRRRSEPNTY